MELLTPGVGLIFWQLITFVALFFFLAKMAWKPIMESLKIRETSIQEALDSAEKAKQEMASLQENNEKLLAEAREERDKLIKDARDAANAIKEGAKADASKISTKMIDDAKAAIETEKNAALAEVKNTVAELSIEIAEKVLKQKLGNDKAQKELVDGYVNELKLN